MIINSNLHIEKYGVNATTQKVTSIKVAEEPSENVSINGESYTKGGTVIGTLSLGDITLEIPVEAGDVTVEDVVIENDGETLGTANLKITFTE